MIFTIILLALLIPILAIVLDSPVGKALAQRVQGGNAGTIDAHTSERMAYLEGEVERLSSELHRLDEESRFLTRLLTERAEGGDPGPAATGSGGDQG